MHPLIHPSIYSHVQTPTHPSVHPAIPQKSVFICSTAHLSFRHVSLRRIANQVLSQYNYNDPKTIKYFHFIFIFASNFNHDGFDFIHLLPLIQFITFFLPSYRNKLNGSSCNTKKNATKYPFLRLSSRIELFSYLTIK